MADGAHIQESPNSFRDIIGVISIAVIIYAVFLLIQIYF